ERTHCTDRGGRDRSGEGPRHGLLLVVVQEGWPPWQLRNPDSLRRYQPDQVRGSADVRTLSVCARHAGRLSPVVRHDLTAPSRGARIRSGNRRRGGLMSVLAELFAGTHAEAVARAAALDAGTPPPPAPHVELPSITPLDLEQLGEIAARAV